MWRYTRNDRIVEEYHTVMHLLYELGWDDVLDGESLLPYRLMPSEYLRHNNLK